VIEAGGQTKRYSAVTARQPSFRVPRRPPGRRDAVVGAGTVVVAKGTLSRGESGPGPARPAIATPPTASAAPSGTSSPPAPPPQGQAAPVPNTAAPTFAAPTYPPPSYPTSTHTTDTGVANAPDSLAGTPYWSVIVTSAAQADGGRATAEASAASLRNRGFTDAFVVFSSTVPSLNAGYWVAATGKYAHRDDAAATSRRAVSAGFADAYPRCFGSSATACGS